MADRQPVEERVTLQLEIGVSLAKFVLAFYSAITWNIDRKNQFQDQLSHDDLAAGLMFLRDNLSFVESLDNLKWNEREREFIKSFIATGGRDYAKRF